MAILPLDNFLCWKLKIATFAICIFTIVAASLAAILEILDVAALGEGDNFDIGGGFKSTWRAHAWEGWLACNLVMFFAHLFMIAASVLMLFAIKRFPTYYEYSLTVGYLVLFVCYILIELGTSLYRYSYYADNIFRLGYLIFTFIYWLARTAINIVGVIIIYSRIAEVQYEIKYGEKKDLSQWASRANLLDARSGFNTPAARTPGTRTPNLGTGTRTPL
jgi:hypothetical protein